MKKSVVISTLETTKSNLESQIVNSDLEVKSLDHRLGQAKNHGDLLRSQLAEINDAILQLTTVEVKDVKSKSKKA